MVAEKQTTNEDYAFSEEQIYRNYKKQENKFYGVRSKIHRK